MGNPVPTDLGNANTWYTKANAYAIPVGDKPMVGAVATSTAGWLGHVAVVAAINNDGTILVDEMNVYGLGITDRRTVNAGSYLYIY